MLLSLSRGGSNVPQPGFSTVQIYDIASDSWRSSDTDPYIAPMPVPRGGMGTGLMINGQIWAIGGETSASYPPNGVYTTVQAYVPATNSWVTGPSLPYGLHGIYPVTDGTYIYVIGGGVHSGNSQSSTALKLYMPTTNGPSPGGSTTGAPIGGVTICPNSTQTGVMLCIDGSSCNVNTQV